MMAWPDERLLVPVPKVSGWSPAQQLYHILLINEQITQNLGETCQGQAPASTEGRANLLGLVILSVGRFPRGRAQAPGRFKPPATIERHDLEALLARAQASFSALQPYVSHIGDVPGRWRHPVFGHLKASQFLHFAWVHTHHHLRIIRDIDAHR